MDAKFLKLSTNDNFNYKLIFTLDGECYERTFDKNDILKFMDKVNSSITLVDEIVNIELGEKTFNISDHTYTCLNIKFIPSDDENIIEYDDIYDDDERFFEDVLDVDSGSSYF